MAKVNRRSKGRKLTIPLAVVAGFTPAVTHIVGEARASGWRRALTVQVPKSVLAYNPDNREWGLAYMNQGLTSILLGMIAHYLIGTRLGVNRMLGRMRIPLVRI